MREEQLQIRVGAAILIGIVLASVAVVVFDDLSWRNRIRAEVVISDIGGLREGADVQVAGQVIGTVRQIELGAPEDRSSIVLHVRIDRDRVHMAPINGEWFIAAKGLFGERYLQIGAPVDGAAPDRPVRDGDRIRGVDPPLLDRLAAVSFVNLSTMRAVIAELSPEIDALSAEIDQLRANLAAAETTPGDGARAFAAQRALLAEVEASRASWTATGTSMDQLRAVAERGSRVVDTARARVASLRADLQRLADEVQRVDGQIDRGRWSAFALAFAEAQATLAEAERGLAEAAELIAMVDRGQGAIGGFLHDHELRDIAKQLNRKIKRQIWEVIGHPNMSER